ncbi:MAG TPA: hypothetical protein VGE93_23620, partial [Bryobacteraceae bacterium]
MDAGESVESDPFTVTVVLTLGAGALPVCGKAGQTLIRRQSPMEKRRIKEFGSPLHLQLRI